MIIQKKTSEEYFSKSHTSIMTSLINDNMFALRTLGRGVLDTTLCDKVCQ